MKAIPRPNLQSVEIFDTKNQTLNIKIQKFSKFSRSWNVYEGNNRSQIFQVIDLILKENLNFIFLSSVLKTEHKALIANELEKSFGSDQGLLAFLTSGSSGTPKIVIHEIDTLLKSASKIAIAYPSIASKRFHHLFPTNYVAGVLNCILVPLIAEGSIFFDDQFSFKTPFLIEKRVIQNKCQVSWMSPGMLASLNVAKLNLKKNFKAFELILSATGPLNSTLRIQAQESLCCEILSTYGTSELLFISGERLPRKTVSIGEPFMNISLSTKVQNASHNYRNAEELIVKTDTIAKGVLRKIENTNQFQLEKYSDKMAFSTCDLVVEDNTHFVIVGRTDDMIVLGGHNISLSNIENIANSVDGIIESCARAKFEGTFSSLELLYEVSENSKTFKIENLVNSLKVLGYESTPRINRKIKFIRNHNGKIDKFKIRYQDEGYI